eukprot:jgi/Galph1/5184/GphlegSOOS_G3883.1
MSLDVLCFSTLVLLNPSKTSIYNNFRLTKPYQRPKSSRWTPCAVFFKETEQKTTNKGISTKNVDVNNGNMKSKTISFDSELNDPVVGSASTQEKITLDSAKLKEYSERLINDVTSRPTFYGQILIAFIVSTVLLQIVGSIQESLGHIPLLPNLLELVGIGYTCFFIWRYISYPETRLEVKNWISSALSKLNVSGK